MAGCPMPIGDWITGMVDVVEVPDQVPAKTSQALTNSFFSVLWILILWFRVIKFGLLDPDRYFLSKIKKNSGKRSVFLYFLMIYYLFENILFQWPQKCPGRIRIRIWIRPGLIGLLDPDPSFRSTDPQIWIRKKYLRIHNTVFTTMLAYIFMYCYANCTRGY